MDTPLTPAGIRAEPACATTLHPLPTGETLIFRPLAASDAAALGRYFLGLSEETRRRYAPHPFDQATADQLCATADPADTLRMVGVLGGGPGAPIIAYLILVPGVDAAECGRYAAVGITLDEATDCTLAPSVADAWQSRGLGSRLLPELLRIARRLGKTRMVLMGGVQATNARAVHFYEKHGFRFVAPFEEPPGRINHDMILDL
jgi:GNAT superfamily N-acetyltransferase